MGTPASFTHCKRISFGSDSGSTGVEGVDWATGRVSSGTGDWAVARVMAVGWGANAGMVWGMVVAWGIGEVGWIVSGLRVLGLRMK